ncbi:hypothetical protein RJT34_30117 [Clitoria ternatea]|uniref:Uncharacterized protein n=1 Tax=Clitoria ternatea TaxID=43366 RepID=A0AAN9ESQ5_CLITE
MGSVAMDVDDDDGMVSRVGAQSSAVMRRSFRSGVIARGANGGVRWRWWDRGSDLPGRRTLRVDESESKGWRGDNACSLLLLLNGGLKVQESRGMGSEMEQR